MTGDKGYLILCEAMCGRAGIYETILRNDQGDERVAHLCMSCRNKYTSQLNANSSLSSNDDIEAKIVHLFGKRFENMGIDDFISDNDELKKISGIMKGYSDNVVNALQEMERSTREFLDHFLKSGSGSLFLGGPPGCGKTLMEAHIVRESLRAGKKVSVENGNILSRNIQDAYGIGNHYGREATTRTIKKIIEGIHESDLVVIEDLSSRCFRHDIVTYIQEIIEKAYADERAIIVSSNMLLETIRKDDRLGKHIVDRMMHPPSWQVELPSNTPSWRVLTKRIYEQGT